MSQIRTRWAAIGAAVAVTMGAGGIAMVSATTPTGAVAFVPIEPCRVLDLRPGNDNTGPRNTPLNADETYTINAISNTNDAGNCASVIPTNATAISMNVTTTDATAPTFLTIWDGTNPRPVASSLNPAPDQPPTPNAVTTNLNTNGQFSIYNLTGTVNVLADINGYYTDHHHDDRYYTKTEIDDTYYTQAATDALLDDKADADQVYSRDETNAAIARAAGAWRIDIAPTEFDDGFLDGDLPSVVRGTAPPPPATRGLQGYLLPDSEPSIYWFGWALPPTYEAGVDIAVDVHWAPELEESPADCTFAMTMVTAVSVSRPGAPQWDQTANWANGASTPGEVPIGHPGTPIDEIAIQTERIVVAGTGLESGDALLVQLGRNGTSGNDKCLGNIYVTGVTVAEL